MVALSEKLHHSGTAPRLRGTGYRLQRVRISVDSCNLQGSMNAGHTLGIPDDLLIDHCSLEFERSAGANEIIYCGYRCDPEAEPYYVRNRRRSPIPGMSIQRDPIEYAGAMNL